jgi:hypothetical protein
MNGAPLPAHPARPARAGHAVVIIVVVVVVGALFAACAPPPADPETCAAYADCFFVDDGAPLRALADDDDPDLGCYDSYADGDAIIDAMIDAYTPGGLCFRGGLSGADGPADEKAAEACIAFCTTELQADCRRQRDGKRSVCADACADVGIDLDDLDDDAVDAFPVCPVTE